MRSSVWEVFWYHQETSKKEPSISRTFRYIQYIYILEWCFSENPNQKKKRGIFWVWQLYFEVVVSNICLFSSYLGKIPNLTESFQMTELKSPFQYFHDDTENVRLKKVPRISDDVQIFQFILSKLGSISRLRRWNHFYSWWFLGTPNKVIPYAFVAILSPL